MIHMYINYMHYNRMILLNESETSFYEAIFLLYHVQSYGFFLVNNFCCVFYQSVTRSL
jgi:hypothetical protein